MKTISCNRVNIPTALRDGSHPALCACRRAAQAAGPSACPGTGSNQAAPAASSAPPLSHQPKGKCLPPDKLFTTNPRQRLCCSWAPGAGGTPTRQTDRHDLSAVQTDSKPSQPTLSPYSWKPDQSVQQKNTSGN